MRYAITAFLAVLCSAWLSFDLLFLPFGVQERQVEIPEYCGMTEEELSVADWMELAVEYRHDDAPAGTVIAQEPPAKSLRKLTDRYPTCRVRLTVSLGREKIPLPDLLGADGREAESRLRALGFSVAVLRTESEERAGSVLRMQPEGGTPLLRGSEVTLTVSAGRGAAREVRVPALIGMTRAEALLAVWRAGLSVDEVVELPLSAQEEGRVLRQSLVANTLVEPGTRIIIYVASRAEE